MGLDCGLDCGLDWDSTGTRLGLDCGSIRRGAYNACSVATRQPCVAVSVFVALLRHCCAYTSVGSMSLPAQKRRITGQQHPPPPTPLVAPPPSARYAPIHGKCSRLSDYVAWRSATVHAQVMQCMRGALRVCKRQRHAGSCGAGRSCIMGDVVRIARTQCLAHNIGLTRVSIAVTQHLCQGTVDGQYYASLFSVHVCSTPHTPCLILSRTKPVARPFRT